MQEIQVKVAKRSDRKYLVMYYDDPATSKRHQRSTKKTVRRDADREAAKWEDQLREGRYKKQSNISWGDFCRRYEDEVLPSLADQTDSVVGSVFATVNRLIAPQRLRDVTAERLSIYQAKLRTGEGIVNHKGEPKPNRPRAEATIRTYLAHLKAALKWAVDQKLLTDMPVVKMPVRAKSSKLMKGRPIVGEEFDRLQAAVPSIVGDDVAASWRHFFRGLWLSGLRLNEALNLSWDEQDGILVDLDGRRPMLVFPGELQKNGEDQLVPITPDFHAFLMETPEAERTGRVFRLIGAKGRPTADRHWVSRVTCRIGKRAGIIVKQTKAKTKYASAHDLRRSFGERWSRRIMPVVLQSMMRHASIETTMRYYVGQNADASADAIWNAAPIDTFVDTNTKEGQTQLTADDEKTTISGH